MTKYFKKIGSQTIKMSFSIPHHVLVSKGWTKIVEDEPPIGTTAAAETVSNAAEQIAETPPKKRGRKPKTN